jgi:hypothetical protein
MSRRSLLEGFAIAAATLSIAWDPAAYAQTQGDTLPSWNDGPAKQAILDFVRATTDTTSKSFVPREDRIATFDQDGTLWVEHPV